MKKILFAVIALVASVAWAQNSPLPSKTFSFTGAPISLPSGKETFVGTDAGITFQPTANLGLSETNILSSNGKLSFFGGGGEYSVPVLSRWINDHTSVSGFRLRLGVRAFAGIDRVKDELGNTKQYWSGLAQGTLAYSFDKGSTFQMAAHIGMARFPGFAKGWIPVVELGPQVNF